MFLMVFPRWLLHPARIAFVEATMFLVFLVMAMMLFVIAVAVSIIIPDHAKREAVEKQCQAEKQYQT